jgi:hypothetical protein
MTSPSEQGKGLSRKSYRLNVRRFNDAKHRVERTGDVERTRTRMTNVNLSSERTVRSTLRSSRCLEMVVSRLCALMAKRD